MINFKDDLNKELSFVTCDTSPNELISKAKPKHTPAYYIPPIAAAVLVLVILAGICFMPNLFGEKENSFIIYAGAQALNKENYVVLTDHEETFVYFDFNKILDKNADPTEITKKYLFHSFEKTFNMTIEGEYIDAIHLFVSSGSMSRYEMTPASDGNLYLSGGNPSYSEKQSGMFLGNLTQKSTTYTLNPIDLTYGEGRWNYGLEAYDTYMALNETGELITNEILQHSNFFPNNTFDEDIKAEGYDPIAYGFKTYEESAATQEEIKKLKEYAEADDMVGFYNYQNQIFKRLIDNVTIDVLVLKASDHYFYETTTIELLYTPIEVTEADIANTNQSYSLSKGTISAKLTDMNPEREELLLQRYGSWLSE